MQINYMELTESVIMDITGEFRDDIAKTDFFDFVVTPDSNDTHSIQQFTKQMRSVNAFLTNGSPDDKETNNNTLLSSAEISHLQSSTADCVTNFDATFWNDKETVKIETAILEDLNKYCWSSDDTTGVAPTQSNKSTGSNTDGQIYTLTVLNGIDQNASWYRPPSKEDDGSISSPSSMDHLQSGIDIESILSIMPGQLNGFNNNYNENTLSPNTDGLIKSETYTYDDSGFADNKEELASSLIIDTPLLEAHDSFNNNNNNDWKLTNNNVTNGSADSLLRSALQGKAFVRYNGSLSNKSSKVENNTELRRALSTPPNKTDNIYIKDDSDHHIPTIVAGIDENGKVIFEEHLGSNRLTESSENPTSTQSMDDILLSQLDPTFHEDYEKIKRIASEVAESVNQYCQIETSSAENTTVYSINGEQIILNNISSPIQITTPLVTSTKPTKKYKRSNNNNNNMNKTQATVQCATSTSNGVRKERSLHYCSICSKGFKDKYSVNVHIRTHTGEKPFACSLCGKSFRQKAHLAKHYQTHIAQKNAAAAGNVTAAKAKSR